MPSLRRMKDWGGKWALRLREAMAIINMDIESGMTMRLQPLMTNLHIHTPYSFSAFDSVDQAVTLAKDENVVALGISDFDTVDGFHAFAESCQRHRVYPIFGTETIALSTADQSAGRRWNDPNNPGRIYFCGVGMQYPVDLTPRIHRLLREKYEAMQLQMRQMIDKLNAYLRDVGLSERLPLLDYERIRSTMTEGTVRERHLAKALERAIACAEPDIEQRRHLLQQLYRGQSTQVDVSDTVALQEEIRGNLLKAGKPAFVPEETTGYLSLEGARDLMIELGGIACYPALVDGTKGPLTEVERDPERLVAELQSRDIHCMEFIPTRNDISMLKDYVEVCKSHDMILICGTEHNTPALEPMQPRCRGGVVFDEELLNDFWRGACCVAGYQHLRAAGQLMPDYVRQREYLEDMGEKVIRSNTWCLDCLDNNA